MIKNYLERADTESLLAEKLILLSEDEKLKTQIKIPLNKTFYSSVISHSYYAIFYAAKALLLTKRIRTQAPEVHKKTYNAFKKEFVDTGILDLEILKLYKKAILRADTLLAIMSMEKKKRGDFTYKTIPQANKEPAKESVDNAKKFIITITEIIESKQ